MATFFVLQGAEGEPGPVGPPGRPGSDVSILKKISPFCFCYHKFLFFLRKVREFHSSPIRTSASVLSYVNGNMSIIIIIYDFNYN